MRTLGTYLIFAVVALRGAVVFSKEPDFLVVVVFLSAYGLLLLAETRTIRRTPLRVLPIKSSWLALAYFVLQSGLVVGLLVTPPFEDFFALLFVPLSLDGVAFFGRRSGYLSIAFFSLALTGSLVATSLEGQLFGLAMGIFYSGICFLFGGYAHQVQKAKAAQDQNVQMFSELQIAHRQLQGYTDQMASLAVEQERNRLARELHDSVTQTVFSMNLAAQSAHLLLAKDPPRASGQLLRLEELAANALSEIQSLISQLRPRSVAEEGLPIALRRLVDERRERDGLQVFLEVQGQKALSKSETVGLFSIAQEALINVAKHSGVCEAIIRLNLDASGSCLEVEDHGLGFDPQPTLNPRGHLGLPAMSERALEIGWSLSIESRRGEGTCIRVMENPSGESQ